MANRSTSEDFSRNTRDTRATRDNYAHQTHRPLVCLVFVAPLLLLFQAGAAYYGTSLLAPRDLGRLLQYFGATGAYLPALLIVAVLMIQHLVKRDRWAIRPGVPLVMVVEAILWTVPLVVANLLADRLMPQAAVSAETTRLIQDILKGLGAGIYEEFIFRLALISLAMLLFVDVLSLPKEAVAVCAVLVTACLFSLYHFPTGLPVESFPWKSFLFYALAGIYLGGVYVTRGFGIAVGTHAFYNLVIALLTQFANHGQLAH
jgi:membrane protease YdiL (CAAX protease family)